MSSPGSYDEYWAAVKALDAIPDSYAAATSAAKADRDVAESAAAARVASVEQVASGLEQEATDALASARRALEGIGEQGRLAARARPADPPITGSADEARSRLRAALRSVQGSVTEISEHREQSRLRRLAEAEERERLARLRAQTPPLPEKKRGCLRSASAATAATLALLALTVVAGRRR